MMNQHRRAANLLLFLIISASLVSASAAGLFDSLESIGESLGDAWQGFLDGLDEFFTNFKETVEEVPNPLEETLNFLGGLISLLAGLIVNVVNILFGLIIGYFGDLFGFVVGVVGNAFNAVITPLEKVASVLGQVIETVVLSVGNAFKSLARALSGGSVVSFAQILAGQALIAVGVLIYFLGDKIPILPKIPVVNKVLPILSWIMMGIGVVLVLYGLWQGLANVLLGAIASAVLLGVGLWIIYNLYSE